MRSEAENTRRARRVVVIGGGLSGLAAAHRFVERQAEQRGSSRPVELILLEASARAGGIVRTERRDGFLLEAGPDAFIREKPAALELAKRLGLDSRLIETNPEHRRSFVARGRRLHPTPAGFQLVAPSRLRPFFASGIFSWPGKARMALDLVLPRRARRGGAGDDTDDESLASFVRRRLGREALERMAQPMVGGIYTADPELLSLRATMPRFLEMVRARRSLILALRSSAHAANGDSDDSRAASGARYNLFLSFDEGMQVLTDALAARLPRGTVRLDTRAERLDFDAPSQSWNVETSAGERLAADAVAVALPAHVAAELLRATDTALASELDAIPYASSATVNLAFRRDAIAHPLDGFGFVVPFVERRTVLACTFASVKFAGRAPEGHALLRAFVGGALQPEKLESSDDEMTAAVLSDLNDLVGVTSEPLFASVTRWPRSMPQYHLGHLARVARIRERLRAHPSLRLAGNCYDGTGVPDCVRTGEAAADELLETLADDAHD
ncbi:MAG TPA: protoporphyrinogen oxidase [Pyrinomonadaceae bacterium]|nr:protoporphyrinogen oxidase [Pyrinomonadaceae bacterium]